MLKQYWYKAPTKEENILHIGPSKTHVGKWALFLNDMRIEDGYEEPEKAAECANKKDFSTEEAISLVTFYVPWNLDRWRKEDPRKSFPPAPHSTPAQTVPECKNRFKKDSGTGRLWH